MIFVFSMIEIIEEFKMETIFKKDVIRFDFENLYSINNLVVLRDLYQMLLSKTNM